MKKIILASVLLTCFLVPSSLMAMDDQVGKVTFDLEEVRKKSLAIKQALLEECGIDLTSAGFPMSKPTTGTGDKAAGYLVQLGELNRTSYILTTHSEVMFGKTLIRKKEDQDLELGMKIISTLRDLKKQKLDLSFHTEKYPTHGYGYLEAIDLASYIIGFSKGTFYLGFNLDPLPQPFDKGKVGERLKSIFGPDLSEASHTINSWALRMEKLRSHNSISLLSKKDKLEELAILAHQFDASKKTQEAELLVPQIDGTKIEIQRLEKQQSLIDSLFEVIEEIKDLALKQGKLS